MNQNPEIGKSLPSEFKLKKQIAPLDGFRGLAVILVMAYHFIGWFSFGWIGVDLFFVLSGFLITGKLWESVHEPGYYASFYLRRLLRIVPAYFLVLIIFFLLIPLVSDSAGQSLQPLLDTQLYYWTFTLNIYDALHGWPEKIFLVHLWSVATEMQFYLIWPFIVMAFARKHDRFALFLGILCVVAILFRVFDERIAGLTSVSSYVMLPARMDAFCLGALVYVLSYSGTAEKMARYFLLLGGVAFLTIFFMLGNNNFKWHHYQSIVEQVGYTLNAVLWAGLIGYSLGMPAARSTHFLSLPFMRRIGRYSYGMYLFHLPVGILVNKLVARYMFLNGNWNWLQQLFFIVLSFALTFVLGMVSYHVYENRFLRMKARIGVKGVAN